MSREVATAYTGANVSITIGDNLITNAFGISWELSQNKRPIYGYNSMHYDAVATGQVIVLGQLYLNYQHPNYLSRVLYNYFQDRSAAAKGMFTRSVDTTYQNTTMTAINTKSDTYEAVDVLDEWRGGYNRQLNGNYNDVLNTLHEDANLSANYGTAFSGGNLSSSRQYREDKAQGNYLVQNMDFMYNEPSLEMSQNLSYEGKRTIGAIYARPDHFTNNEGLRDQINIVITHGNPDLNGKAAGIMSYMPSSSIILRGVHFIGEAQQVMSDDQPIMETYKFIARVKETLLNMPKNTEE